MKRALLLLVAILAIAGSWFLFSNEKRADTAIAVGDTTVTAQSASTIEAPKAESERSQGSAPDAQPVAGSTARAVDSEVTIVGRLLRFDRSPASGAELAVRFERQDARYRPIESTPGLRATSAEDGRFRLAFLPAPSVTVRLEAEHALTATARWTWREPSAGQVIDL